VPRKKKKEKKEKKRRKERKKEKNWNASAEGGEKKGFAHGCIYMCMICLFYELKVIIRSSGNMTAHRERDRFRGGVVQFVRRKAKAGWNGCPRKE